MKRKFKYFTIVLATIAAISCSREVILPDPGYGSIMVDVTAMPHTKAFSGDDLLSVGAEAYVRHIDLFVFENEMTLVHYERISYSSPAQPDTKILGKSKSLFEEGREYDIYAIANSTASSESMAEITTVQGLAALTQTDEFIHFTGLDEENVPAAFLMDAKVRAVLNPEGKLTENITVNLTLSRAAAKVVVVLTEGPDVAFQSPDNEHVYHFRNLPYSTAVLPGVSHAPSVRSTMPHQVNGYVDWSSDGTNGNSTISITGYVYAYDYKGEQLDKHTSLVVNIPIKMTLNTGSGTEIREYPVNYYKVPLTNNLKFERNSIYRIQAEVNAPGAQSSFDPIKLEDLSFSVVDWHDDDGFFINVGGQQNKPKYLQLNTDHVDMYNVNRNEGTLSFSSSSYITDITLTEAYYYDAYDKKINLSSTDNAVYNAIEAVADANVLNGGITIESPFVKEGSFQDSHRNTIRYMKFVVRNGDGLTEEFTVAQYPTLYITNEVGTYSYREDFSGRISGVRWSDGSWEYRNSASEGSFFASKVAVASSYGNGYTIYYANWNTNGTYQRGQSTGSSFSNPRMYHIHVTATSKDYIVARPKLDKDGYTESSEDNSKLVSPSFFIASQLGATELNSGTSAIDIEKARRHCKEYIEVSGDKVYKDWRLPTKEEIDIIADHQPGGEKASPAIATVMNGSHYYCAFNPDYKTYTGSQANWIYTVRDIGNSGGLVHVRCVHDAY